jgi:hypothetical protein
MTFSSHQQGVCTGAGKMFSKGEEGSHKPLVGRENSSAEKEYRPSPPPHPCPAIDFWGHARIAKKILI